MALRAVSSAEDWHRGQVNISNIHLVSVTKFDKTLTALCQICIISTHLCDFLNKHQEGSPHWLSSFYCVRLWAIQPSENGIIYSLSTSGMLAPLSLTTAGQFTLVPLTPSSVTAAFTSKSVYKYIADKEMASERLICSRSCWRGIF